MHFDAIGHPSLLEVSPRLVGILAAAIGVWQEEVLLAGAEHAQPDVGNRKLDRALRRVEAVRQQGCDRGASGGIEGRSCLSGGSDARQRGRHGHALRGDSYRRNGERDQSCEQRRSAVGRSGGARIVTLAVPARNEEWRSGGTGSVGDDSVPETSYSLEASQPALVGGRQSWAASPNRPSLEEHPQDIG